MISENAMLYNLLKMLYIHSAKKKHNKLICSNLPLLRFFFGTVYKSWPLPGWFVINWFPWRLIRTITWPLLVTGLGSTCCSSSRVESHEVAGLRLVVTGLLFRGCSWVWKTSEWGIHCSFACCCALRSTFISCLSGFLKNDKRLGFVDQSLNIIISLHVEVGFSCITTADVCCCKPFGLNLLKSWSCVFFLFVAGKNLIMVHCHQTYLN